MLRSLQVKTDEPEDDENQLLDKSTSTIVLDDSSDDDTHDSNDFLRVFKSYESVYHRCGRRILLTRNYRYVVSEMLKITADYPNGSELRKLDFTPVIPALILPDRKATKELKKALLTYVSNSQLHKRTLCVIHLAAPKLKKLKKRGVELNQQNMAPIFQSVILTSNWSGRKPCVSMVLRTATKGLIAKALAASDDGEEDAEEEADSPHWGYHSSSEHNTTDSTDDDDSQANNSGLGAFKAYEDIYKQPGNNHLSKEYKRVVDKILKLTVNYPDAFYGFDIVPALPSFVLKGHEGQKKLKKKLLTYIRRSQLRKRAFRIIQLAAPKLEELRRSGLEFSNKNMSGIFEKVIDANRWNQNNVWPLYVCKFATDEVIAKVLDSNVKKEVDESEFENDDLEPSSRGNDTVPTETCVESRTEKASDLEKSDAVNRGNGILAQAQQEAHSVLPLEPSSWVQSSRVIVASRMSSIEGLPEQSSELPAATSSREAAFPEQSDLWKQISSKMGKIPSTSWGRLFAELRNETNKRLFVKMLEATTGLPREEQLELIRQALAKE